MYVDECSARNSQPDLYMDLFPGHPGEKKVPAKKDMIAQQMTELWELAPNILMNALLL